MLRAAVPLNVIFPATTTRKGIKHIYFIAFCLKNPWVDTLNHILDFRSSAPECLFVTWCKQFNYMTFSELIKHNGASVTDSALEQRARRMARKQNKFITKADPRSRWYGQYGPYMGQTYTPIR
jgi:hypothetical protein